MTEGADIPHTEWSDPGPHRERLSELPAAPREIADALEEFVIHHAVARQIGFAVPAAAEGDRSLRHVSRLLGTVIGRDERPLSVHRDLPDYLFVTCRDFAMLAVAALRERGVPARLRAGFASYFVPGTWEDHYVCEYRGPRGWSVLDAQLGPRAREGFRIPFDIAEVPLSGWRPAAMVWREIRSGALDASLCGLTGTDIRGPWWVASSALRDAACLAGIECLPWDDWGPAVAFRAARDVSPEQATMMDELAASLVNAPVDLADAGMLLARFPWAAPRAAEQDFFRQG